MHLYCSSLSNKTRHLSPLKDEQFTMIFFHYRQDLITIKYFLGELQMLVFSYETCTKYVRTMTVLLHIERSFIQCIFVFFPQTMTSSPDNTCASILYFLANTCIKQFKCFKMASFLELDRSFVISKIKKQGQLFCVLLFDKKSI